LIFMEKKVLSRSGFGFSVGSILLKRLKRLMFMFDEGYIIRIQYNHSVISRGRESGRLVYVASPVTPPLWPEAGLYNVGKEPLGSLPSTV
jgi:hypothetical protein